VRYDTSSGAAETRRFAVAAIVTARGGNCKHLCKYVIYSLAAIY